MTERVVRSPVTRAPVANPVAGGILLAQAAVITAILVITGVSATLPVTFLGEPLSTVHLGAAAVVLLVFCAIVRFIPRDLRLVEFSQVSGITVFLIAQLNGITEVTALVPLYAIAAGATLFLVLHDRDGDRWSYSFGAAVGIVPWGVIAFAQIGSGVVGDAPAPIVRIITLGMLALLTASWTVTRLAKMRSSSPVHLAGLLLGVAIPSVLAWLALLV